MEPTKNTAFSYAIKWGMILAIVLIALRTIVFITNLYDNALWQYLPILAIAAVLYVLVKKYRDHETSGFLAFGKAFNLSLQIYFYSNFLAAIYSLIYTHYINPTIYAHIIATKQQKLMEQGLQDDQIDTALKIFAMMQTPLALLIFAILYALIAGSLVSLIVASLCKKENPEMFNA